MDHAVGAAGEHDVGVAMANHFGGLADGLAAGGTGREAAEIGPLDAEMGRQVGRRGLQLLLRLGARVKALDAAPAKGRHVQFPRLGVVGHGQQQDHVVEILDAFAGAEIDAHAATVVTRNVEDAGIGQRLLGGGGRKGAVQTCIVPAFAMGHEALEVEVLHLGGKRGRKGLGTEMCNWARRRCGPRPGRRTCRAPNAPAA